MRILVTCATVFEIRPFLNHLSFQSKEDDYLERYRLNNSFIDLIIPGVGMMFTAYHLGRQFLKEKYDCAINAGICGSYSHSIPIGSVVEIVEDCISELGAEDKNHFLTMFDLGLMDPDTSPYHSGKLTNTLTIPSKVIDNLPKVNGITVNTVHGNKESIERVKQLFDPQTESMEGAAFLYSCLMEKIPNTQIRSVSNFVEERNRATWNLDLALKNLNKILLEVIHEIAI